ncbi:MAG TPA: Wzz/FepE/Etk N-terminal domain-containing protein [Streptosporangiaceae bacterium]
MSYSSGPDSFEIGDYLGVLRRRGWLILILTAVGLLAAAGYLKVAHKTYTASTLVYVQVNAANANQLAGGRTTGAAVNMDNEAQIVQSNSVAAIAAKTLHSPLSLRNLLKQVSVSVPANSTVLSVSCSDPQPAQAAACAQAFANGYLSARQATAEGKIASEQQELQGRITNLLRQENAVHRKMLTERQGSPIRGENAATMKTIKTTIIALRNDISTISTAVNTRPGYIITAGAVPTRPSSPNPLLYLPSGLVAGLILGLAGAFILDSRDDRLHATRDVERFLDLPVLVSLAQKKLGHQTGVFPMRTKAGRAFSAAAQAITAGLGDGPHVIVAAAASQGEGGSVAAVNLAAAIARSHGDVILVCADAEDAIIPQLLSVGDGRGAAEVLAGKATVAEVVKRPADTPGLRVLTPGLDAAGAIASHQYDTSRRLVAQLQQDARYVVIEAPPNADGPDNLSLAEFADAAVVTLVLRDSKKAEASDLILRLDRMRTQVLGALVLPPPPHRARTSRRSQPAAEVPSLTPPSRRHREPQSGPAAPVSIPPRAAPASSPRTPAGDEPRRSSRPRPAPAAPAGPAARPGRNPSETLPLPRISAAGLGQSGHRQGPAGGTEDKKAAGGS